MPGQKIRFVIQKNVQEELRAVFWRYWKITSGKREPVCSSFPQCGGCMYQTMPYEEQLHMKERQIRELLEEVLVKEGQTDLNGKQILCGRESMEVRKSSVTEIKWNFLLEMNIRTGLCLWDFTKRKYL